MAKKSGAEILLEAFKREGVEVVFGYPGGAVIPIFDKLYDSDIKFYLVRHEQGAAHMADGYARATGKVGVCIATSGPGATNLVTGIATAYMDSIPIVAITGQVKTHLIGNDAFQEADLVGITRPITKHNYLVKDVNNLARVLKEAFHIARTGRPGPVLIDLPVDVSIAKCEFKYPSKVELKGYNPQVMPDMKKVNEALDLIKKSRRPILYVGGGVILSNASAELTKYARKTGIPVTTTLNALGAFPEDAPMSLGMLGMHGTAYANHAVQEADLLISVGARFDDRVTGKIDEFAPHAKLIHIDIDPSAISKTVIVDVEIVGDARETLKIMLKSAKKLNIEPWREQILAWKKKYPLSYDRKSNVIKPQYVMEVIRDLTKGAAIIVTEVGQNQMWAAQWYCYKKPRTYLSSGGLGTMGYGFPAAIGAQIGCPDKLVFDIAGDGSIQMNIQEFSTAVGNNIPVKIIILNNGYLGMVRQWQELFYGRRYAHTDLDATANPDFVKLANAYGVMGMRVEKKSNVKDAIKKAIDHNGPVIVDVIIDREENVFPMVPAGQAINRMIGGMA